MKYMAAFLLAALVFWACGDDTVVQVKAEQMGFWMWVHLHTFWFIVALFIIVGGVSQMIYHAGTSIARMIKGPTPHIHLHILHDGGQSITLDLAQDEIRDILQGRSPLNPNSMVNDSE